MEASFGSEESLINSFEKVGLEDALSGMSASLPYKPEDEDESEQIKICSCQVCRKCYEDDYYRHVWTPSIKLENQFICTACQLEKWISFKKLIKDATVKYGFDIVDDKTMTNKEPPSCLIFKMDHFGEETLERKQASVGSEAALINSFKQVGLKDALPGMSASFPYKPEDEDKSEEIKFCSCQDCKDYYEDDYYRDMWTPSIKLEDQFICTACQRKKWRSLKKFIKTATVKYGFDIVDYKTESLTCTEDIKEIMKLDEERNASTKAIENLKKKKKVSTQADENLEEEKDSSEEEEFCIY